MQKSKILEAGPKVIKLFYTQLISTAYKNKNKIKSFLAFKVNEVVLLCK